MIVIACVLRLLIEEGDMMDKKFMKNLEYILPLRRRKLLPDVKAAICIFDALYGKDVLNILTKLKIPLKNNLLLHKNKAFAIKQIKKYINRKNDALIRINSGKLECTKVNDGKNKKTKEPGFDNNCAIANVFIGALIAFDKILTEMGLLYQKEDFEFRIANLINTLQSINQLDKYIISLEKRQSHRAVAYSSADKKRNTKKQMLDILRKHGIKFSDANQQNVLNARKWYFEEFKEKFPYSDKKLHEYIECL